MSTSTRDVNSMNTFDFWDNGTILSYKICKAVNALSAIDSVIREGVDHPSNYAMGLSFITETLTECARELDDFTNKALSMYSKQMQKP